MGNGKGTEYDTWGLHGILFEQLERLTNPDLVGEQLQEEIQRTNAVCKVAGRILDNGQLALNVARTKDQVIGETDMLKYLEG